MKKVLKLFTVFLCAIVVQSACFAKNFSITIISDAHLSADKEQNHMTSSVKKLLSAVKQANVDTSKYVVYLGDNVQSANRHDIALFSKIIAKTKKPYFVVLGNRDVSKSRNINKKEYYRILNKFSSNKLKNLPSYKKEGEFVFIFLSGVNETFPSYRGYFKKAELSFLGETLTKFKDKKIIIFQHFPVVPPKEDEDRKTVRVEDYLNIISKHQNILAVVSGHYHTESIQTDENGIKHISVPALSSGEYEQIKIFKNKNSSYTITTKILNVD